MSNLKSLYEKIRTIQSLPTEVVPEYEEATDADDEPTIYIDGFIINQDEDDSYSVMDENNAVEDFAGTENEILEFFKGLFDAYVENYDESKGNDYYDKGFQVTEATAEGSEDDDDDDYEEED